jgi:hypothetical protein
MGTRVHRKIFVVEPTHTGWRIVSEGREMSRWRFAGPALERASRMADATHLRARRPTGVEIRYPSGDGILTELHG